MESVLEADRDLATLTSEDGRHNNDDDEFSVNTLSRYPMSRLEQEAYQRQETCWRHIGYFDYDLDDQGPDSATLGSNRSMFGKDEPDWVWEHGRRYSKDYSMPNDLSEQVRQFAIHQVYLKLFDGELTTVPLDDPKYVVDVGTGIGEWAIDVSEKYPGCEVFGTDIAAIQPPTSSLNVEFLIEDAEEEWIWPANTVDLVHLRNMAGAFSSWSFIYQQAFACIKPGGYIEVLDFDEHKSMKNFVSWFPEGSAVEVVTTALRRASVMDGRPKGVDHLNRQLLADAGFVDIEERQYDIPLDRNENEKIGDLWLFVCATGVEATCLRLLTRYMGWDRDYFRNLCNSVSEELKKMANDPARAKGFVVKLRVLVGRKPEVPPAAGVSRWMAVRSAGNAG